MKLPDKIASDFEFSARTDRSKDELNMVGMKILRVFNEKGKKVCEINTTKDRKFLQSRKMK